MPETGKEVQTIEQQNLALFDKLKNQPVKRQELDATDIIVPRLRILQPLSPQLQPNAAEFIKEARPGDFLESGTNTLYPNDPGLEAITIGYRRTYIEWQPRTHKDGSKFIGEHGRDPAKEVVKNWVRGRREGDKFIPDPKGRAIRTKDTDNEIVLTAEYLFIILTGGYAHPVLCDMSRTQFRKAQALNTQQNLVKAKHPDGTMMDAPLWWQVLKMNSVPESNNQGNWYGWKIIPGDLLKDRQDGLGLIAMADDATMRWEKGEYSARFENESDGEGGEQKDMPF